MVFIFQHIEKLETDYFLFEKKKKNIYLGRMLRSKYDAYALLSPCYPRPHGGLAYK